MAKSKWTLVVIAILFGAFLITDRDRSEKSIVSKVIFSEKNDLGRKPSSVVSASVYVHKLNERKKTSFLTTSQLELKKVVKCYEKMNCPFPQTDSRSYDLAVGRKLKEKLEEIYEEVSEKNIVDEKVSEIARDFLKIEDGHVKEAALLLISSQPASDENLTSILKDVINYHDSTLLNMAFMEFEKYKSYQDREMIEETIINNIKSGSILVREGLASKLANIISEDNKERFVHLMRAFPPNSIMRRNLKNSLKKFEESTSI